MNQLYVTYTFSSPKDGMSLGATVLNGVYAPESADDINRITTMIYQVSKLPSNSSIILQWWQELKGYDNPKTYGDWRDGFSVGKVASKDVSLTGVRVCGKNFQLYDSEFEFLSDAVLQHRREVLREDHPRHASELLAYAQNLRRSAEAISQETLTSSGEDAVNMGRVMVLKEVADVLEVIASGSPLSQPPVVPNSAAYPASENG